MPGLKVTYIDFSLFTAPYDGELIRAVQSLDKVESVSLFARSARNKNEAQWLEEVQVHNTFSAAEKLSPLSPALCRIMKGVTLPVQYQRLLRHCSEQQTDIVHFQWLNIPKIDMRYLIQLSKLTTLVLTLHDTEYLHGEGSSLIQGACLMCGLVVFVGVL
ncbi:MAG: hypothetical protein HRT45_13400, partial [Bdellovibrionales bacterium]|nr:hypothetical protein [Bdellovibrionales bacterium]